MKTLEIDRLWRNCWRLVLPLDSGAAELTARRLAGKETDAEHRQRVQSEAAIWHPLRNSPRSFWFPLSDELTARDVLGNTLYPLTPKDWAERFGAWCYFHRGELSALGLDGRDVDFGGPNLYDSQPKHPQAFAVWLEWLEEHEQRRLHWERFSARFGECIEAGADESELRALLTNLNAPAQKPE
jgi:hypothetical protein